MSSCHLIIVARNTVTGKLELPMGDMTLYGVGGEEDILNSLTETYDEDWVLCIYGQKPPYTLNGVKPKVLEI